MLICLVEWSLEKFSMLFWYVSYALNIFSLAIADLRQTVQVERDCEMDRWRVCVQPQPEAKGTLGRLLRQDTGKEGKYIFQFWYREGDGFGGLWAHFHIWLLEQKSEADCVHRVLGFFFKVKQGTTKHPGSLGKSNLFTVKKHTSQSCKVSQYWKFPMAGIKTSAKSKCKYRKREGK